MVLVRSIGCRTPPWMPRDAGRVRMLRCSNYPHEGLGIVLRCASRAAPGGLPPSLRRPTMHKGGTPPPLCSTRVSAYARLRILRIASNLRHGDREFGLAVAISSALVLFDIASSAARFASSADFSSRSLADRGVGEHGDVVRLHLEEAPPGRTRTPPAPGSARACGPRRTDRREERRVARVDAELAHDAGQHDEFRFAGEDLLLGADDVDSDGGGSHGGLRYCSVLASRTLPRSGRPCRNACSGRASHSPSTIIWKPIDRVLERDVLALGAGEGLRDRERLRQEALDLARTGHRSLSSGESSSMPRIAMMSRSSFVALQRLLHAAGRGVVLLADDVRVDLAGRRVERVHGRIDAERGDVARQHHRGVEVAERRGGRGSVKSSAGT